MIRDEDLVQVRSADELQVGMTVVIKGCLDHHKTCSAMILEKQVGPAGPHRIGGVVEKCRALAGFINSHSALPACWCGSIRQGRLFRLKDLDAADELRREKRADRPLWVTERVR